MADPSSVGGDELAAASAEASSLESGDRRRSEVVDHDDRLILWMLGLAPVKRLEALQNFVDGIAALRHARKITQ